MPLGIVSGLNIECMYHISNVMDYKCILPCIEMYYYAYEIVNQAGYLHLFSGPNDIKRTTKTSISSSNRKQI